MNLLVAGIDILEDYYERKKLQEWCEQCHNWYDCDEKEEFLESDDTGCPYYA